MTVASALGKLGEFAPALNPNNGLEQITFKGQKLSGKFKEQCASAQIELSSQMVSQISMTFYDPGFELMAGGHFRLNTHVALGKFEMSVAAMATGEGAGGVETVTVTARPVAVRMLKRARGPLVMKDVSPSRFVEAECKRLGIPCTVQKSQKRKRVARAKVQGSGKRESSWQTFQRLAYELGFVVFESQGRIFFGKPTWLLKQTEDDAVVVGWKKGKAEERIPWVPECSNSIDGEKQTVNLKVPYDRWREFRVGRALKLVGVPYFEGTYIINTVSYDLARKTDYITVNAGIPIDPEKPQTAQPWGGLDNYVGGNSLRQMCEYAGFRGNDLNIAVAVAMAESGGSAKAEGDKSLADSKWDWSIGLFQIRSLRHPEQYSGVDRLRVKSKLYDPIYNVEVAYKIWKQSGWSPWSTYTSGAYKKYLGKDYQITGWTISTPQVTGSAGSLGVMGHVALAASEISARFKVTSMGGYRDQDGSDHQDRLAVDFMCGREAGDGIAAFAQAHAVRLHVQYIIWRQRIWNIDRASEGWRGMEDRGSITSNHYDHVHISFKYVPESYATIKAAQSG